MVSVTSGAAAVKIASSSGSVQFSVYDLAPAGGWLLVSRHPSDDPPGESPPGAEEMAYRAFFEQAPVGIVHLDSDGHVTFENHALRQIVGENPDDAWLGRHVMQIGLLQPLVDPLINGVLSSGTAFDGAEVDLDRADGTVRHLKVVGSPIRDYDGAVAGGVLTVQDTTEARRAEELSRRARTAAEAASRMKSALIATISHELRTPAGTIHGYASMLEQELQELGAETLGSTVPLEFAEAVRTRAADLVRLVGDLTELSQLETGTVALQPEKIDVGPMLTQCVADLGEDSEHVPVHLSVCEGMHVWADRMRVRHAFDRVIGNAVKFTPHGRVDIRCSPMGGTVHIQIADTGVGIDPDRLDQVFEAFSQEDDPMTRRFEGAGLGLAIVRRIIELMDGTIKIESEKDKGTTVGIYLPAAGPDDRDAVA